MINVLYEIVPPQNDDLVIITMVSIPLTVSLAKTIKTYLLFWSLHSLIFIQLILFTKPVPNEKSNTPATIINSTQ